MRATFFPALAGVLLFTTLALLPYSARAIDTIVNITDTAFIGKTIDIASGNTVTWVNAGIKLHRIQADNGSFGSAALSSGMTYSQQFTQPGTYPYYDSLNGGAPGGIGMSGVIRVAQQSPIPVQNPVPTQIAVPTTQTTSSTNVAAQTQALYAQVVQLQQLLASLQANATTGGTVITNTNTGALSGAACPRIGRVLKPGMTGDDVVRLQQYLASDASLNYQGGATGYYGVLTQAAVQRWQIKNNIVSTGDPESTGFGVVGPRTAAAMSLQCSTGGTPTTPITPSVGGFIQVTPVSGDAPLLVSVQASVNTVNSCQGATYILDWGDGSTSQAIPVSANTCSTVQQTYTHTYQYGGQYTIKLSAGGHESTAVVAVSGPVRPATGGNYGGLTLTAPIAGQNLSAGQTISIAWQSNSSLPAGSTIVFDLYTGAGQEVPSNDVIAISGYASGSFGWVIPVPNTGCPAIYPGKLCGVALSTGSYKIVAKAYAPSTSGNTYGALIAEASSGVFTILAAPVVNLTDTFTASLTSGPTPLTVTFAGKVTSANDAWCEGGGCFNLLQFGDGGAEFIALPTTAGSSLGYSVSHTYANTGVYTAKLFQSQDTSGPLVGSAVTISVGNAGANFSYGPLEIGPGGDNVRTFAATFDLPTACTAYKLNWGDSTAEIAQTQTASCAQTPSVKTLTHTYAQGGSYTISLLRGASLDRTDSVGVALSTGN